MTEPAVKTPPNEEVPEWVGAYMSQCIGCVQIDNHPKLQTGSFEAPPVYWHHDCFVIAKVPGWEDIHAALKGAEGITGHALRLHLLGVTNQSPQEAS